MNIRMMVQALSLGAVVLPFCAMASSHREAPDIAGRPRVDGSDFYMFRSYEPGRSDYITVIANYIPLQDPAGGPNFYNLDTNAVYEIHINNTGDATSNLTFSFSFSNQTKGLAVDAGGQQIDVPLLNTGRASQSGTNINVVQYYTVRFTPAGGTSAWLENASTGGQKFAKPVDNIGNKSIPDYTSYVQPFIYDVNIPGCGVGRVFVGQRKEGFVVNLGEVFDLVNLNPAGPRDGQPNTLLDKNVTSLALELPIACVKGKGNGVIGGYTTASLVSSSGTTQVSRLGMPLVNELVIGLPDKDKFNASVPTGDAQFLKYVTNPSVPVLLNALYGNAAMVPGTPRNDLVAIFLTGVKGLNQQSTIVPSEMLRLNTNTPPTPPASQNDLGVLAGDAAGYPNGRRPYDDVVDITLRAAEGALCGVAGNCGSQSADPNKGAPYTDEARAAGPDASHLTVTGAVQASDTYLTTFPYLNTPIPGSPNGPNGLPGPTGISP